MSFLCSSAVRKYNGVTARIRQSPAERDAQWPVEPLTPHQRAKAVQGQFEASLRYARRSAAALAFGCARIFEEDKG